MNDKISYLDLFSGIGGFALGIIQAGVKFNKHYFSEIDKYATQIYKRHFPTAIELGDIKEIKPETLGKIDLITFGFPCQDLSIAGKRAGLGGTRSGLFFEAMRIINELCPSVFIFENVKGLLTSNEGKDFEIVLREIADIGVYECEWQLVNTSWVLPQNRERVYFVGHLGEKGGQKVFPVEETNSEFNKSQFGKKKISSTRQDLQSEDRQTKHSSRDTRKHPAFIKDMRILDGYNQNFTDKFGSIRQNMQDGGSLIFLGGIMGDKNKKWLDDSKDNSRNFPQGQRVYSPEGNSAQLASQGGGWGAKTGLYQIPRGNNKGGWKKDICPSISTSAFEHNNFIGGIRRLTPTECEYLQGFPKGYTKPLSDTQRYKCLGNAVSVPIVKMIIKRLMKDNRAGL